MSITIQDLEIFLEHSTEIIGVLSKDGTILKANKRWEKVFSRPLDMIIGLHVYELVPPEDEIHYKKLFQKLFIQEKVAQHYFSFVNNLKEWITIDTHIIYVNDLIYLRGRESTKEDTLLQSLQMMSRVAKIGAWHYNVELKKFYCSQEFRHIFEIGDDTNLTLNTVFECYQSKSALKIRKRFDTLLQELTPFEYTGKINTLQGVEKWVDFKAEIISYHDKHILVSGIIADVTKEQNYIESLRHHSETQKLALKGIKSGIFDHDLRSDKVYYSRNFKRMLGLSLIDSHIPEKEFRKMIHPEDTKDAYKRHIDGINAKGHHYFNHYRLRNIKGIYNHYEVHAWRKKDKTSNKTVRMIGNLINIEDRIQKQRSISQYQRRLKAIINNGYLYTILLDVNAEILFVDNSIKKAILKEFKVDISKNKTNFLTIFPSNFDKNFNKDFKAALQGKKTTKEINRVIPDGTTQWYEISYTPIFNDIKDITSILIHFMNITTRKKSEIQYKKAKQKTEELSELKSSILMNLSHEIRTPLNGILGVNNLLSNKLEENERKELLRMQKESSDRLINTLEGMISLSQINTLSGSLNLVELDVNTLITECYHEQLHNATSKKITFDLDLSITAVRIMGDRDLLKISIDQLINNAIKFTERGTITIRTSSKKDFVKISIEDTGIGIHKKNQKKIFEMFVQESQGLSRIYEGTGIGLTMAQKYTELMDGEIKVKSEPNKGSRFTIKFPLYKNDSKIA